MNGMTHTKRIHCMVEFVVIFINANVSEIFSECCFCTCPYQIAIYSCHWEPCIRFTAHPDSRSTGGGVGWRLVACRVNKHRFSHFLPLKFNHAELLILDAELLSLPLSNFSKTCAGCGFATALLSCFLLFFFFNAFWFEKVLNPFHLCLLSSWCAKNIKINASVWVVWISNYQSDRTHFQFRVTYLLVSWKKIL